MELFLLCVCALCGVGSVLALLRASVQSEGLHATVCVLVGSCLSVATVLLLTYIVREICR